MKCLQSNKAIKAIGIIMSYVLVIGVCVLLFKNDGASESVLPEIEGFISAIASDNFEELPEPENYTKVEMDCFFGEWEIIEDLGYRGIHKYPPEDDMMFEVGKTISFYKDRFHYEGGNEISHPRYIVNFTDSAEMEMREKITDQRGMGLAFCTIYVRISVENAYGYHERNGGCILYVLRKNEILVNRQQRLYRAVKKPVSE